MPKARGCPHCSTSLRERDFGWACHRRSVGNTPTRDSAEYWRRGPLPDHGATGLYLHGPDDASATLYDLMTDVLMREQVELDAGFGQRLHQAQAIQSRYNVVQFLALSPHLWGYVKMAMGLAQTPIERRREIRQWLKEAREMRERMIEASKREAARLATR